MWINIFYYIGLHEIADLMVFRLFQNFSDVTYRHKKREGGRDRQTDRLLKNTNSSVDVIK